MNQHLPSCGKSKGTCLQPDSPRCGGASSLSALEHLEDTASVFPEHRVAVRGQRTPNGDSPLLPETIGAPTSNSFPVVWLARQPSAELGASRRRRSLESYAEEVRRRLDDEGLLSKHGVVLLRGVPGLATAEDFSTFVEALGWERTVLAGGGTERTQHAEGVRSASDEPPTQLIEPHCDMAHSPVAPSRIGFFMLHGPPADAGGETVLVDMRGVTRDLTAAGLPAYFDTRGGIHYKKQLWSSKEVEHSFTWQRRFFSEKKAEVEDALKDTPGVRFRWEEGDVLHFGNTLPATTPHPNTGESLWFNGAHTNHRSYFELSEHIDTSQGSPFDTEYADGTSISEDSLAQIRAAWWRNAVAVTLQSGDVVLLDNRLVGHGRMPWTPGVQRSMLVAHFL